MGEILDMVKLVEIFRIVERNPRSRLKTGIYCFQKITEKAISFSFIPHMGDTDSFNVC